VVDRPARRGDDDVEPAPQAAQLLADRLAAVHGEHPRAEAPPVAMDRLGHLHRQLARRHEDEGQGRPLLRPPEPAGGESLEDRQGERRRLAGPRRGLGEEVATGQQRRDRLDLDRRRLLVAETGERLEQGGLQAEGDEGGGGRVGRVGGSGRVGRREGVGRADRRLRRSRIRGCGRIGRRPRVGRGPWLGRDMVSVGHPASVLPAAIGARVGRA